ncbi:MAG: matrixin family metalloprotease, partial [Acidobacteria bacterium]|nr:matrixin family metalloprotease [Acidobacteriota bacterium]
MTRRRQVPRGWRLAAVVLSVLLTGGSPAEAYLKVGISTGTQHVSIRWAATPVRYYVNEQALPGLSTTDYRAALDHAFTAWQDVGSSTIAFQFAGTTSGSPLDADGLTALGFLSRPDLDRVLGSTGFIIDTVTGEIVEGGILFNTIFPWSTASAGEAGKYDLESIALHEIGHLAGLGHSALGETELRAGGRRVLATESVMFPIAYSAGSIAGRTLRADDIAGVSDIYPESGFRTSTGSVTGRVTKNGQGVYGAHVVAFNTATGKLVGNFALNSAGEFAIAGLDAGSYLLRAEPLDDADVSAFFPEDAVVDVSFQVTYLERLAIVPRGGNVGPFDIKVAAR